MLYLEDVITKNCHSCIEPCFGLSCLASRSANVRYRLGPTRMCMIYSLGNISGAHLWLAAKKEMSSFELVGQTVGFVKSEGSKQSSSTLGPSHHGPQPVLFAVATSSPRCFFAQGIQQWPWPFSFGASVAAPKPFAMQWHNSWVARWPWTVFAGFCIFFVWPWTCSLLNQLAIYWGLKMELINKSIHRQTIANISYNQPLWMISPKKRKQQNKKTTKKR